MLELLGLTGGICFAISGIPTALKTYQDGRNQIPISTAWLVWCGAILTLAYLLIRNGFDWVITADYFVTICTWSIVLRYHYFPVTRLK